MNSRRRTTVGMPSESRLSMHRQSNIPLATPIGPSRRVSAFTGRLSTNVVGSYFMNRPTTHNTMGMRDPRSIRSGQFIANSQRLILNYLTQSGYPRPVSQRNLSHPTGEDFRNIFKFIYSRLDANYGWGKRFEEDVLIILKGLNYPFADTISKTSLYAVGASNSWPNFLAALHWMVELATSAEQLGNTEPDFFSAEFQSSQTFSEQAFFDYLSKAYCVFLGGQDDFEGFENDLAECFERKNRHLLTESEQLKQTNETLRLEMRQLSSEESPLVELNKKQADCLADLEKFHRTIQLYEQKKQKLQHLLQELQSKSEVQARDIDQLKQEKVTVQEIVDSQEISPADIDRMNNERQKLAQVLQELGRRIEELNREIWQKEIDVQPRIDGMEQAVQDFNAKRYKLGMTGTSDTSLPELRFEPTSSSLETMLSIDLKRQARPVLSNLRLKLNAKFLKAENDRMAVQEELDTVNDSLQEKSDTLEDAETKRLRLENKLTEEKERMTQETVAHNGEVEILEQEIDRMQQEITSNVLHWQQKAQRATMEFNRLTRQAAERKETTNNELIKVLTDVISFKGHVEKHLTELQSLAQSEAEASRHLDGLRS
ncbi:kinetochore-associated Ndc80 complex subunit ndc80 [Dimargaris verticillata]|uniref:Kinetochore protein NDC80 n=1 Tax=Dimargaris verticillata TaxID=2761393 RepID=A0A9W8B428_9FUNG|nr:kinetochore-associated Ndc80 complex subunit ndc80 [Dimargaris verticillata]